MDFDSVFIEAFRILFLTAVPMIIVVGLAGILVGALQTATALHDVSIGYVARLLATLLVLYLTISTAISNFREFMLAVLQ